MHLEEGGILEELPEGSIEEFQIEGSLLDLIRCEIWSLILFSNAIRNGIGTNCGQAHFFKFISRNQVVLINHHF